MILQRRDFIPLVIGLAVWPGSVGAQQSAVPSQTESSPDPYLAKARAAVNAKLKDPESARYGDMVRKAGPSVKGKPEEVVCGSVSAKDSPAEHGGNRLFVYFIGDGATYLTEARPRPEDLAQIIYGRFCK
jgi:hypothetical protein